MTDEAHAEALALDYASEDLAMIRKAVESV
jgi:hypothetical protein